VSAGFKKPCSVTLSSPPTFSHPLEQTMVLAYLSGHRSACKYKQNERASKIASLPAIYHASLTSADTSILATPLDKLVANIKKGEVKPIDVLHAYGKEALRAHAETNCLTEIMIEDAEKWATEGEIKGPLAGIPGISNSGKLG
jgi:hypothetical protein